MNQLLLDLTPDWTPTLGNFVAGRNSELLAVLRDAITGNGKERFIYLWGEAGSGKSHLLQAVTRQARFSGLSAICLCRRVPEAMPVIAIDDVNGLDEAAQIELFERYNQARDSGSMLLVSGPAAPARLNLREDLRTRLGWGLVYQVHALNDEEKSEALEKHASARGLNLSPEVVQYLLRHGRRDLPSLLSTLDALDTHCLRLGRVPSVPLLKEIMKCDLPPKNRLPTVT